MLKKTTTMSTTMATIDNDHYRNKKTTRQYVFCTDNPATYGGCESFNIILWSRIKRKGRKQRRRLLTATSRVPGMLWRVAKWFCIRRCRPLLRIVNLESSGTIEYGSCGSISFDIHICYVTCCSWLIPSSNTIFTCQFHIPVSHITYHSHIPSSRTRYLSHIPFQKYLSSHISFSCIFLKILGRWINEYHLTTHCQLKVC